MSTKKVVQDRKKIPKPLTPEQEIIHTLSERIVQAQRPIRILDAIKWDNEVEKDFFKHLKQGNRKLPSVTANYYEQYPLNYDPEEKMAELYAIEHDIRKELGQFSGVSQMMQGMCREYRDVINMLQHRGKKAFGKISQQLYGSSDDAFYANAPTLKDLAQTVSGTLTNIKGKTRRASKDNKKYTASEAVELMAKKLETYFVGDEAGTVVQVSDDIVADAAAGAETIKLRKDVYFSERNIRQLVVHEGWVHLGTTLNGKRQPICTFLSKGVPSSTVTQEGLAILMEVLSFSSYPERLQRITNRITAIHKAENGADFLDIFSFYQESGYADEDAYAATVRVFRGSTPKGLPFTKDLSYTKGFVEIFNYIRLAIHKGLVSHIPMLFTGKVSLENLRTLVDLVDEGLVIKPRYVPPQFKDPAPLCAWAAYSLFINRLDPEQLYNNYKHLLRE